MSTINNLNHTLQTWIRWLRVQRALTWYLRGLAAALGLSLLFGGVGLAQAKLLKQEFLALVVASVTLLPILSAIIAFFWNVNPAQAARHFDRAFHLEERISTALELSTADHANEMVQKQLDDAVSAARTVKPRRDLPLRLKRFDSALTLIFALLIAALWFRGEALFAAASRQRAVEQAIAAQQEQIEEIIKEINENDALTAEQKQELTEPLNEALQALDQNPSLEGAVSVLTNTGEKLQALDSEQAGQTAQALKEAGSSLQSQEGTPLESVGQNLANGDFTQAANELNNMDLSQMSAEELQKLAEQLQATAESLSSTNPQLAQALQQAAEEIRKGDLAAAQQALANASQQMANAGQQVTAAQTASQAASQMQTGAGQLLAAGGGNQSTQANGQGQQGNGSGGQNGGAAGSGAGSGDSPDSPQQGDEAGSSPIEQNNGAGDGGESAYEQIYAPSLFGGENGDNLGLPSSGTDGDVVGTSPTTATDGLSLVPYTNVFAQYQQFYYQAIENGQVPIQFYDLIRNYFISLK